MKKIVGIIIVFLIGFTLLSTNNTYASTTVKGTFEKANYTQVQVDNNNVVNKLTSITIKNDQGKTNTYNIDQYAKLSVDTITTKIDAFKMGMKIEADIELRKVKALRGSTGTQTGGTIEPGDKVVSGIVSKVDRYGEFISVKFENGNTKSYYFKGNSSIYKDKALTDLSSIYEGDRVKISLTGYNSIYIDQVEVMVDGIQIENLYKGTIQRIEPTTTKLVVKNEQVHKNWRWQNTSVNSSSYTYSAKTPIYVGNEQIKHDKLRYYAGHDVYYVTINKFGKEVIEKMVIKKTNERTYYQEMSFGLPTSKSIFLKGEGYVNYHNGSILIRNGRLVDPTSIQSKGTAFVVTDGSRQSEYANVVLLTNDGFQSPNLADHTLYYGQISTADLYTVKLKNTSQLTNNSWQSITDRSFSFSNDTIAVQDYGYSLSPIHVDQNQLKNHVGQWGYFYVADGTVVAAHVTGWSVPNATRVSVGIVESTNYTHTNEMDLKNVSEWSNGTWIQSPALSNIDIGQATIIKDGKVIEPDDLQEGDRIYMIHDNYYYYYYGQARFLLVD